MSPSEDAYLCRMPLTDLRPRLTRRLLDNLSVSLRVTTVGELLIWARDHGTGWMSRIAGVTRAEQNRMSEALENFWLEQAK